MTIELMRNNILKLQKTIQSIGIEALVETKKDYIDLNIDQLLHGKKSDGSQIGRYSMSKSWKWYADKKYDQNPLAGYGNKDLIDKKDFIEGIDIVSHGKSFEEFSHDEKQNLLVGTYGPEIFGLQDQNLDKYRHENFYPSLMQKVRNIIYNG